MVDEGIASETRKKQQKANSKTSTFMGIPD